MWRLDHRLSLRQVAEEAGYKTPSAVHKFEYGELDSASILIAYLRLGAPVEEVLR